MTGFKQNEAQRKASESLGSHCVVAAAAGSGKTGVLAQRCANAVIPGRVDGFAPVSPDRLLAITYTEKAAGELAERVRATLRQAGRRDDALAVDSAWISTIHGMCSRVLRSLALDAGLDPMFSVLDSVESGVLNERAFNDAAENALEHDEVARWLFDRYGWNACHRAVADLRGAAVRSGIKPGDFDIGSCEDAHALLSRQIREFTVLHDDLAACGVDTEQADSQRGYCAVLLGKLLDLGASSLPEWKLAQQAHVLLLSHAMSAKRKGIEEIHDALKQWRADAIEQWTVVLAHRLATTLIALCERYTELFEESKRRSARIDFDDMQTKTLELLESRPDVAGDLRSHFGAVMVDEFQDTDALQLSIVKLLADRDLCTVGDELQSIYRFRGANVAVYREHIRQMREQQAVEVALSLNYRSHRDVLGLVNDVFERPFKDALVRLEAGRGEQEAPEYDHLESRIELLLADGDTAPERRRVVADAIADRLHALHTVNGVPLSDMVVLLKARAPGAVYAEALRARGMEAVVVGGEGFYGCAEVFFVEMLCRAIGNRCDEEALWSVLVSPMCDLSDDGLLAVRRAMQGADPQPMWDAMLAASPPADEQPRLRRIVDALQEARVSVGSGSLGQVLLTVFERTGWDLRCFAEGADGRQVYGNVLKLARMANEFSTNVSNDPIAFAQHIADRRRFESREQFGVMPGEGTDAVRLMTIHASKGLEFPVVVVPELDSTPKAEDGMMRLRTMPDPAFALQLPTAFKDPGRKTSRFLQIHEENKHDEAQEMLRLFYVAFTRARELLILGGSVSKSSSAMVTYLLDALKGDPHVDDVLTTDGGVAVRCRRLTSDLEAGEGPEGVYADPADGGPSSGGTAGRAAWNTALGSPPVRRARTTPVPHRLSYSAIAQYVACPARYRAHRLYGAPVPLGRSRDDSALRFGRAVHAALQLRTDPADADRIGALAKYHDLDEVQTRRLVAAVESYHASDVASLVDRADRVLPEAPFAVRVGSGDEESFILDGSIDLYAQLGETAVVIDYKTGTQGDAAELSERYRLQARCYALAALKAGAAAVRVVFVRPEVLERDGSVQRVEHEFDASDAAGIERELLAVYEEISAGRFDPASSVDGRTCDHCVLSSDCERRA